MSKARDIADLDFNSPDIDGGNIDGATIGGTTPAAGTFSGLTVNGSGGRQYINSGHIRLSDGYNIEWGGGTNFLRGNNSNGGMALNATGNLIIDVVGDIELNADGGDWLFKDGSVNLGSIQNDGNNNLIVMSNTNDKDIKFLGIDNSNTVTALLLDMSDAGTAIFNHDIKLNDNGQILFGSSYNGTIGTASGDLFIGTADANILFYNGSSVLPANSAGGARDNAIDLGSSSARFKDLFLSGNIALTTADNASAANMFVSPSTDFLYLEHPANGMIFRNTSGAERLRITSTGGLTHTSVAGGHVRFNSGVIDSDFTVSSGQYSHIFHVDGGNNSVSFGTSVDMGALVGIKPGVSAGTMYDALVLAGGANSTQGSGARLYISGCANDPIARGTIIEGKMTDNGNSHELAFYTSGNSQAPTKKMSITSSGELLVGEASSFTAISTTATGLALTQDGRFTLSRAGVPMNVGRIGSDGSLIDFWRQGAQVGSVSTWGGNIAVGRLNCALLFNDDTNRIIPSSVQSNTARDNVIDLGDPSHRFNDVWIGGGIHLGGTSSSHKLNDYEEGSWTPTVFNNGGSLTVSYNFQYGHFTKIGNLVQLYGSIRLNSASGGSGRAMVKGLPFTPDTALYACVGITHYNTALPGGGGADYKSNMIYDNGINFEVNSADQDTGEAIGSWEAGYIGFSITYRTSQ